MNRPKRPPVLIHTLSCRCPDELFKKLVAGSQASRRQLSDFVRLLLEAAVKTLKTPTA
jgi:hypothetical protein